MQALRLSPCNTFLRPKPILPASRSRALQAELRLQSGVVCTWPGGLKARGEVEGRLAGRATRPEAQPSAGP